MAILCGTDFSEPAARAARVAAFLAMRQHVDLELIHVLRPDAYEDEAERDAALRRAVASLRTEASALGNLGPHIRTDVRTGVPDEALPVLAEERKADLLVIGALGRRPPSRWKLGTTAERAVESSPVPALVVRDARPFEAWFRGERSLRVVVAADFSRRSNAALAWVSTLRGLGPLDVTVLHIYSPGLERERLGLNVPADLVGPNPEIEEVLNRQLAHRVLGAGAPSELKVEVRPGAGQIAGHLVLEAEAMKADLIVVGTHRRQGLGRIRHGSVSNGVLHEAGVSVAVVPGPAPEPEPRIQRVLVGVDFSPASERAVRMAFALAGSGGTVWLVHARKGGEQADSPQLLRDQLLHLVPASAERSKVTVDAQVVESGEPAEALRQCAEQADADLICLGTRGRSGIAGAIVGSVSRGLLAVTRRPVLLVRAEQY